jgi:hypothetical protein
LSRNQSTQERTLDTREKLIAARVGMLALADELKNISRACQVAGISRTHFYDIKDALRMPSSGTGGMGSRRKSAAGRGCRMRPRPSWWRASWK